MNEHIILALVSIIVLGIASQWLAWKLRISSVIPYIFFGCLAALNFTELMGINNLYQLPLRSRYEVPVYLRGRMLFNQYANYDYLKSGQKTIPLFVIDNNKKLTILSEDEQPILKGGSNVFILTHSDTQDCRA